jgi:DNA-binding SARP family transcriptional activator
VSSGETGELGLAYGRQVLVKDPLLEEFHCHMMRFYGQLGNRSGLVRQHQHFSTVLADELGVEPMPEKQQLYQALLSGRTAWSRIIEEIAGVRMR